VKAQTVKSDRESRIEPTQSGPIRHDAEPLSPSPGLAAGYLVGHRYPIEALPPQAFAKKALDLDEAEAAR